MRCNAFLFFQGVKPFFMFQKKATLLMTYKANMHMFSSLVCIGLCKLQKQAGGNSHEQENQKNKK